MILIVTAQNLHHRNQPKDLMICLRNSKVHSLTKVDHFIVSYVNSKDITKNQWVF
jgi:hypothetical protein